MFDPESREEGLRNRSLFSIRDEPEASESLSAPRDASLLSTASEEDAVARHRRARAQRGAETAEAPINASAPGLLDRLRQRLFMAGEDSHHGEVTDELPAHHDDGDRRPAEAERRETAPPGYAAARTKGEVPAHGDGPWQPLIDPTKVIMGVVRSRWIIAATTVIGAVLGVLVALATPKEYYAATELVFDPRDISIVDRELTRGGLPSDATLALVENQVRVITSGDVLRDVVERLNLAQDPEFNGQAESGLLDMLNPRALLSLFRGGGEADDSGARWTLAINNLADSLDVERNPRTFIIVIGVTTQDPEKSARIASTVADVFLETVGRLQSATASRANEEITGQLDELRAEVEQAERAVAEYKAQNDLVDAQGRLMTDDEMVGLNEQLSSARARTAELNARADSARSLDVDSVLGGALPEQIASPVMTELLAQYASLKQQADRLAVRLGPRHPDLLSVQAEIAGARESIQRELRRVVSSIQVELQRAVQIEQDLAARLARLKVEKGDIEGERVTLRELEREAAARRAVYESLLLRARETGQQRGFNTSNISIISEAYPPLLPTGPSRSTIAMAGMILGFIAGVGIGVARGAVDSFRDGAGARRPSAPPGDYRSYGRTARFDGVEDEELPDPPPPRGRSGFRREHAYRDAGLRDRDLRERPREAPYEFPTRRYDHEPQRIASDEAGWRGYGREDAPDLEAFEDWADAEQQNLRRTRRLLAGRSAAGREYYRDDQDEIENRSREHSIEEIRQRLRAFRDELDHLAERRAHRRYG